MSHHFSCQVYYEDTDMAGIVYYANYLKFIERARSTWIKDLGMDQKALREDQGIVFAVRRVEADYIKPAYFDDVLDILTTVEAVKPARLFLVQKIMRAGDLVFEAQVTIIAMDNGGRPQRLPDNLRQKLMR